ncbi:piggyBac transposable element-derived protein 3 [Trichonephila clavipes]|uniref:PiggyBac transposable element-derived protein 3 n=1 Tax=Trichonephila clavipes TaxID=2585209 RepID=A0A8X6SQA6_TRICX|nr:piggyBac transposable element-derived protein 3 [Trichonephila clavipes]
MLDGIDVEVSVLFLRAENKKISAKSTVTVHRYLHSQRHRNMIEFQRDFGIFYGLSDDEDFKATGTILDNQTGKCPLKSPKEARECQRSNFSYRSYGQVYICQWKDSVVVTIASNYVTLDTVAKTKRFCRAQKKKIDNC